MYAYLYTIFGYCYTQSEVATPILTSAKVPVVCTPTHVRMFFFSLKDSGEEKSSVEVLEEESFSKVLSACLLNLAIIS